MLGSLSSNYRDIRHATRFAEIDYTLIWAILFILTFGLVMVYSSTVALGDGGGLPASGERGWDDYAYLIRHGLSIVVGLAAAAAVALVPMRFWQRLAPPLFLVGLLLLILVFLPVIGYEVNGSKRWLNLGVIRFQPSELVKLFVVFYAADYTVRKAAVMDNIRKGFLPMAAVMSVTGILLLMEPDFGAFFVIVCIAFGIVFLGGMKKRLFFGLFVLVSAALTLVVFSSPYRRDRIIGFLNPFEDEFGKSYQLTRSLISFARGEFFGVGLGASMGKQAHLPEAHTDFLLAIIGEELGFVGVLATVGLFAWVTIRAFGIGRQAILLERYFSGLVAQGVAIWVGVQALINMGVNMGMMPTKGLTLPLMSYGGTSLVATCIALATLLRVDYENRRLLRGAAK